MKCPSVCAVAILAALGLIATACNGEVDVNTSETSIRAGRHGELHLLEAFDVDRRAVEPGDVIRGRVSYVNRAFPLYVVRTLKVTAHHVASGTTRDLQPQIENRILQRRQSVTLTIFHAFEETDPTGRWELIASYEGMNETWYHGAPVEVVLGAADDETPVDEPGDDPVVKDPVVDDPITNEPVEDPPAEDDPIEDDPVDDDPSDPGPGEDELVDETHIPDDPPAPSDGSETPGSPWLRTDGNQIVTPDGEVWIGRGFNIHDTRSCNACTWSQPNVGEVKRRIDEAVAWGADFLRLNLESYGSSGGRAHWENVTRDAEFLDHVIEIVDHVGTHPGVYVMVSLWHDPTFNSLGWPTHATVPVWELLASELRDRSHVIYGLVNEPQHNWDGAQDSEVWEAMNRVVAAIRQVQDHQGAHRNIIAVQGTRGWARSVDYYRTHPITAGGGENIVYETHPYNSPDDFWDLYERAAQVVPVIIGEFGPFSSMTTDHAETMMDRAERLGIPYLAWTFHQRCPPNLLVDHSNGGCGIGMRLEPTAWGRQMQSRLQSPPRR